MFSNFAKVKHKKPIKKFKKILVRTLLVLLILLVLVVGLLSIPSVQTFVADKVTNSLNESYDVDINIKRLGLNWKGQVAIQDVYIADHHGDTLIYTQKLNTTILDFNRLFSGQLFFGDLDLENAKLYIKTYQGEDTDNLSVFSKKFAPDEPKEDSPPFILETPKLSVQQLEMKIVDENLENTEVFSLSSVNLNTHTFLIDESDISTDIENLSFVYNDSLRVKKMSSAFTYTDEKINLDKLLVETDNGTLLDANILLLTGEDGFSDFENNVQIEAEFKNTTLSTNDINVFYDGFGTNQTINFSTNFNGNLNDFELNNLNLTNQGTSVTGDFEFTNILDTASPYSIVVKHHDIQTNYYDLRRLMPKTLGDNLPEQIKELGSFSFVGTTRLYGNNIDLNGVLQSAIGEADANFSMEKFHIAEQTTYRGSVAVKDFNLGKLTKTTALGEIEANLTFDGKGFTEASVNTEIRGTLSSFYFNDYNYTDISVSGFLKNPVFNGELTIDDPNLEFDFQGLVDVSERQNHYDFQAQVHYADLNKINLVTRDSISIFTGNVEADLKGTNIDDVVGTIKVSRSTYQNLVDDYFFDDVAIISSFEGDERTIEVVSPDIATGKISGQFLIEDLPNLFQNSLASMYANYVPEKVTTNQYVAFDFEIFNKIVEIFVPELKFGDNTVIRGSVASDESEFQLNFRTPEITAFDNYIENLNLQIDNDNPLFNTYVDIDSIDTGVYQISDFDLINVTINDTLFVRTNITGGSKNDDKFNLSLYHTINEQSKSVVGMKKSDVKFKENVWLINEQNDTLNKITFDNDFKDIAIDTFTLSHQDEFIELAGQLRDSSYKDINLDFKNVDLAKITPDIDSLELSGVVNGTLDFRQDNNRFYPQSNVTIDSLMANDFLFGNLQLDVLGSDDLTLYEVNVNIRRDDIEPLNATGLIEVNQAGSTIDLQINFDDLNISPLNPFGGEDITNIRGFVSGSANVVGKLQAPDIYGRLNLNDAGMKIDLLNVDMAFDDGTVIDLDKNRFNIPRTAVTDTKYETKANLEGYFEHNAFSDWQMNLDIGTQRFLVLDTDVDKEALYYGTAFIDGTASIAGPIDELVIDVAATTDENTSFKIPISDTYSIGDDSFVYFLSPEEKQARISGEVIERKELKGLSLNFDLDITRDAEVEIVVDVKNNSTLKGRGEGTLFIEINTLGRFNMWGDFQVFEAQYNFKYGNFVQKPFQVERGGNIYWDGRPEDAQLDLKAIYQTTANPSVLLDNPSTNQKIPVEAAIILNGSLSSPEFEYEINFPNVSSVVKSELEFKLEDRQQRELQVLYLVATGSFSGEGFTADQGTSTLVEGVSGMVGDIFADEEGKFNVELAYTQGTRTPDLQTADRFAVSFSTELSERILINGKVGVPVGGVSESTLAGDLEVQLLLNEDGTLRLHFFNREAPMQFIGEDQGFEQGVGISYSVDFDDFKELTNRIFKGKVEIDRVEREEEIKLLDPFEELLNNQTDEE